MHELVVVIEKIIEKDLDGIYTLAENDPVSYIGFYKTLCEIKKIKAIFVPVPYSLMNFLIRLLGFLGFMKGISNENLLGLKNMKKVETINDQEKIGVTLSDYKSTLSRLALKS
ncbi:MAG: hypothetical protein IT235_08375 [Bacteroidia bacterium]|nr:hypothetical protein [Bacteroidia bacterium]